MFRAGLAENKKVGFTTRLAQRSGFGFIIGLLLISTLLTWGIQESFSERSFEIHHRFVSEQDTLTNLRIALWNAGIAIRDYYLNPVADREGLRRQLDELGKDARKSLAELSRTAANTNQVDELESRLDEIVRRTMLAAEEDWDATKRYEFVQHELAPRREEAFRLLREIERTNHNSLTATEAELRDTRSGAASRLLMILGACLFGGILVAWFSIRHAEELEAEAARRFREVLGAKQQLEELSARLMEVQEEERTRLSRELHDEIVQNLAVLKMEIVAAQNVTRLQVPEAREPLARARRLAEETVRSVRDISLLLRPSLLDDLGLGPALQWQAEEFSRRTGVPCRFEECNLSDDLSEAVKTCVYRVTQEALRNCEKHSAATLVRVHVEQKRDGLRVLVEDNGKGFAENPRKPSSLGLLGMRERAWALGGTITTKNRAEGGASLELKLPVVTHSEKPMTGAIA